MSKNKNNNGSMSHNVWYVDSLKELIYYRNQALCSSCFSVPSHNTNFNYWNCKYLFVRDFIESQGFRVEYIGNLSFILWQVCLLHPDRMILRADGHNILVDSGSRKTSLRIDITWMD